MTQESDQDNEGQATVEAHPGAISPTGKSSGPGYAEGLPTSLHASSKASAVYEQTHTQQNA